MPQLTTPFFDLQACGISAKVVPLLYLLHADDSFLTDARWSLLHKNDTWSKGRISSVMMVKCRCVRFKKSNYTPKHGGDTKVPCAHLNVMLSCSYPLRSRSDVRLRDREYAELQRLWPLETHMQTTARLLIKREVRLYLNCVHCFTRTFIWIYFHCARVCVDKL